LVLICIKVQHLHGIAIKGMGMPCTLQSGPCTSEATKSALERARGQVLDRDGGWCEKKNFHELRCSCVCVRARERERESLRGVGIRGPGGLLSLSLSLARSRSRSRVSLSFSRFSLFHSRVLSLSRSLFLSLSYSLPSAGPRVPRGGVTRQGVVLTDFQSFVDCQ
jgi:hypothetical protein